jgi:16S rRNA U516 pseudouridylate synthase RsuA-like enzyme
MFSSTGARVLELERTGYAGIKLGKLIEGGFRKLRKKEIIMLEKLTRARKE